MLIMGFLSGVTREYLTEVVIGIAALFKIVYDGNLGRRLVKILHQFCIETSSPFF